MRALLLCSMLVFVACSAKGPFPECEEIGKRCHEISAGADATATQKECHENAHETWSAAECTSNRARCFTACTLPDGGAP